MRLIVATRLQLVDSPFVTTTREDSAGQTIGPLLMAATAGTLGLTGAYLAATALAVVALLLVITLLS